MKPRRKHWKPPSASARRRFAHRPLKSQRRRTSIELLSEIGKEITASLDLNTILFKLYERVNQIVDASIFGVGLYQTGEEI